MNRKDRAESNDAYEEEEEMKFHERFTIPKQLQQYFVRGKCFVVTPSASCCWTLGRRLRFSDP